MDNGWTIKRKRHLQIKLKEQITMESLKNLLATSVSAVALIVLLFCFAPDVVAQQDSIVFKIDYKFIPIGENIKGLRATADTTWIKVEWLGNIFYCKPYSGIDPGFYGGNPPPDKYWRNDIEVGLREDGILIWRKIGAKSK